MGNKPKMSPRAQRPRQSNKVVSSCDGKARCPMVKSEEGTKSFFSRQQKFTLRSLLHGMCYMEWTRKRLNSRIYESPKHTQVKPMVQKCLPGSLSKENGECGSPRTEIGNPQSLLLTVPLSLSQELPLPVKYIGVFFGSTGVWTQGFVLARQALHYFCHSASPFCSAPLIYASPSSWDDRRVPPPSDFWVSGILSPPTLTWQLDSPDLCL
jgi:hypothetical protein